MRTRPPHINDSRQLHSPPSHADAHRDQVPPRAAVAESGSGGFRRHMRRPLDRTAPGRKMAPARHALRHLRARRALRTRGAVSRIAGVVQHQHATGAHHGHRYSWVCGAVSGDMLRAPHGHRPRSAMQGEQHSLLAFAR